MDAQKRSCRDLFVLLGASCRWRLGQAAEEFDCWRTLVWGSPLPLGLPGLTSLPPSPIVPHFSLSSRAH